MLACAQLYMILTMVLVEPKMKAYPQSGRVLRKNGKNRPSVSGASKPLVHQECAINIRQAG